MLGKNMNCILINYYALNHLIYLKFSGYSQTFKKFNKGYVQGFYSPPLDSHPLTDFNSVYLALHPLLVVLASRPCNFQSLRITYNRFCIRYSCHRSFQPQESLINAFWLHSTLNNHNLFSFLYASVQSAADVSFYTTLYKVLTGGKRKCCTSLIPIESYE